MLDFRPLRSVGYRHLVAAQWINESGTLVGEVALAILVYNHTRSPWATALLFVSLRFLPAVVAPLLTVRAEAWRPRVVLPVMYIAEAAVFAVIASTTTRFSLLLVLLLVAVDGVCAITTATLNRTAMATGLISDGLLREGNGLLNLGATVATGAAPVVAGVLVASHGASVALLLDAATFVAAALIVATARGIRIESDREAGVVGRIKAGVLIVRSRPMVRRLLIATAVTYGLSQIAIPIEVIFAKTTLHAGDSGYGALLTAWGAGMVAGAALFTLGQRLELMLVLGLGLSCIVLGYAGLALAPNIEVACAASIVGGIGNGAAWVAAKTALQERIPLRNQSAVFSVLDALNQVLPALGFIAGGALAAIGSPRTAYAVSAISIGLLLGMFLVRPMGRVHLDDVSDEPGMRTAPGAAAHEIGRNGRAPEMGLHEIDLQEIELQEISRRDRSSLPASHLANG